MPADKRNDILNSFLTVQQVTADALFPVFLRRQKEHFRHFFRLISQDLPEVAFVCVADNDDVLGDFFISSQKVRPVLEIALAPLVKSEEIGAGPVAIIRQDKPGPAAVRDRVQQPVLHIIHIGTAAVRSKALAAAFSAGMNLKFRKVKEGSLSGQGKDQFPDPGTVSIRPGTE